jgi:hypothetical protein
MAILRGIRITLWKMEKGNWKLGIGKTRIPLGGAPSAADVLENER